MVLLGTIGGLGSMFAFFVSPMLRAYNRISIFIEYVSILAVALLVNELIRVIKDNKKVVSAWAKRISLVLTGWYIWTYVFIQHMGRISSACNTSI